MVTGVGLCVVVGADVWFIAAIAEGRDDALPGTIESDFSVLLVADWVSYGEKMGTLSSKPFINFSASSFAAISYCCALIASSM